jgi:hypothetical protein
LSRGVKEKKGVKQGLDILSLTETRVNGGLRTVERATSIGPQRPMMPLVLYCAVLRSVVYDKGPCN